MNPLYLNRESPEDLVAILLVVNMATFLTHGITRLGSDL
jgi:hypothetical protein